MPANWSVCPVCNIGHSTMTPGAPCSSRCAATQRAESAASSTTLPAQVYGRRRTDTASGRQSAPRRQSGGFFDNCAVMAVALAAGIGGFTAAVVELVRAVI